MIPKITTATVRAGLNAACPPCEKLECVIYCKLSSGSIPLDSAPCFAGITDQGTLLTICFSPEEKPDVRYIPLLSLKKVRIIGAFSRYLVKLTFFFSHIQHECSLLVSANPHGITLPYQPEQAEKFVERLRALS